MSGWGKGKSAVTVKYQAPKKPTKEPEMEEKRLIQLDATSSVLYIPNFFTKERADEVFSHLQQEIPWRRVIREVGGGGNSNNNKHNNNNNNTNNSNKSYELPRLQCWMSDLGVKAELYQKEPALYWDEVVGAIRAELEELLNFKFDYVLMNQYRDGKDFIGFHRDDEADQPGKNVIASLSLGATRSFILKHYKDNQNRNTHSLFLSHGSLVVMMGDTQVDWRHGVPKDESVTSPRINLTFRKS